MTTTDTGSPTTVPQVPALADGIELMGEMAGSGYRRAPALVRRTDGQVVQLTPLLYQVLAAVDGRRGYDELAALVAEHTGRGVTAQDVATLVGRRLLPLGLLRMPDGSQPEVRKANPLLALRFRYVVTDPAVTRRLTTPFATLFHPVVVVPVVAAFLVVCWWVLVEKGLASAAHEALYQPGMLLVVLGITVLSAGFHEFGHAAAARYGGSTPGVMGMGLYLVWPAFYTDVTDSYRLDRAGRVRTDLGGLYFNAIVAVAMVGVWWFTHWEALLLVVATQILQMVRQLAPLIRLDGYHVLADLTGVPDLYQHIRPTLAGLLPHRWGRNEDQPLKTWARVVVSTWVLVVVPLLVATLAFMVLALPRLVATAWDSIGEQGAAFSGAFGQGDVLTMATALVSIVALGLPLFGLGYLLVRLVRRLACGVWRWTGGRTGRQVLAGGTALAVLVALAWAWWPSPDNYRPIQAYERGTLADAVPLAAPSGLSEGRVARASTVWSGTELPTADRPALSVVLVPRTGEGASAATGTTGLVTGGAASAADGEGPDVAVPSDQVWVFPFDRPAPPEDGDNQAMAVNTTDGSTVYDVAFALVWAEGPVTDNVNEAYALASCQACTTVAVALQVVLVVGQSDTVVPQNLAAAVNYACIECVTGALATQLVYTLDGPLDQASATELTALWEEIAAYGANLEGVPLSEIRATLTDYERRIIEIIDPERAGGGSTSETAPASPGATVSGSPAASPTGSSAGSPSASPSGSPSGSPAATASGSTSPTGSPAGTPTSSSSPTTGATPRTTPRSTPRSSPTSSPSGSSTGSATGGGATSSPAATASPAA